MAVETLSEIRVHCKAVTRAATISNDTVDNLINITLFEISNYHPWTFNRRKTTFATVEDQEDYNLPRDLDRISLIRQTESPTKLIQVPDELFYRYIPYPTATGNPKWYRLWEETGVATTLTAADTIDVVSSSASDTSQTISIVGYVGGIKDSEVLTLNGTTAVTGSKTFQARPLRVSKSAATTGTITVTENSGGTTLTTLGPEERTARFKVIGLYPIPDADDVSMYLEYYTRIRMLVNDADVPDMDRKWIPVLIEGTNAKIYEYLGKDEPRKVSLAGFDMGLKNMKLEDIMQPDYIPVLRSILARRRKGVVKLSDSVASGNYGSGLGLSY